MRRIVYNIPNLITSLNLVSGCLGVIAAFNLDGHFWGLAGIYWFYICIGAAALFDFCDGFSARALKAYSELGKELDSLSDLVSFGVAPGMLIFNIMLQHSTHVGMAGIALLIPLAGALRLAKFNVDKTQTTSFRGLPIPANAIFLIGVAAWIYQHHYPGFVPMAVIIALASIGMVCNLRMFSLKFKNYTLHDNVKRYAIILAAIAFLIFYGISGLAWTIILYALISIFTRNREE